MSFLHLGVSQSLLKDFQACKQKALWKLQGWKGREADWSMYFGTLFHDVMEAFFGSLLRKEEFDLGAALDRAKQKAYANPNYNTTTTYTIEHYLFLLKVLAEAYLKKYQEKDTKRKWLVVEEPFCVSTSVLPLSLPATLDFRGKPDAVAEERDGLWLYDHKTKSYVDLEEIGTWLPFDLQMHAYVRALETKLSRKFAGFVYDVVTLPGLKQKWGESLDTYRARVALDVEQNPDLYFSRLHVKIRPAVKEQVDREFEELLLEYVEWNSHLRPTKNKQACFYYGKKCPYYEACFGNSFSQLHRGPVFEELVDANSSTNGTVQAKDQAK